MRSRLAGVEPLGGDGRYRLRVKARGLDGIARDIRRRVRASSPAQAAMMRAQLIRELTGQLALSLGGALVSVSASEPEAGQAPAALPASAQSAADEQIARTVLHVLDALGMAPSRSSTCPPGASPASPRPSSLPRVAQYAAAWLAQKKTRVDTTTHRTYEAALRLHVLPRFGGLRLDEIRSAHVQAWISDALTARVNRTTVHGWFRVLRTMLRNAVGAYEDTALRDPTARIAFPAEDEGDDSDYEPNALTTAQIVAFLAAFDERYPQHAAFVRFLVRTGLRFSHASAIRWDDVDFIAGTIAIRRKQVQTVVGKVRRKKRAPRVVPMTNEMRATLLAQRAWLARELGRAPRSDEWVFPASNGRPRRPGSIRRAWRACLAAAGIAHRLTPHGLRYTFVDENRREKIDPIITETFTGHVTEAMRRHYSHVSLDERKEALEAISARSAKKS